jgi:hypothetical protein
MALLRPDPTFYPSPRLAMQAPAEKLAYVALLNPTGSALNDAILVIDVDPASAHYGRRVGQIVVPNAGDELHRFGWNACSSALCPYAPHPHMERRYLVVPGIRSSRIYILDTKPDPRNPSIAKIIEPEEVFARAGYSRPHTVHCGPEGIYISALGASDGDGPGGIFLLDHFSFDVLGKWEMHRGPQYFSYDFWWHLTQDTLLTSEWGTPRRSRAASCRRSSWKADTAISCMFGICAGDGTSRRSIWARNTSWSSKCGQRMIQGRPTDLLASSSRSRILAPQFGYGTSTVAHGKFTKSLKSRPSPPIRNSFRHCFKDLRRCRRWSATSTSPWTIDFSTSLAGVPVKCCNTTSPIRSIPNKLAQSISVALCAKRHIPPNLANRYAVVPKWSR